MRTIDSHYGPDHRIGSPTECPACAAAKRRERDVDGDPMSRDVEFACGAVVRWRSAASFECSSGTQWCESLLEARACPSLLTALLADARRRCPNLRLGQLVEVAAGKAAPGVPVFYVDDDALADGLKEMVGELADEPGRAAARPGAEPDKMMSVAFAAFRLALNNTPFCRAVWRRMQDPKPGDLVMEHSRAAHIGDPMGIGRLVRCDRSRGTGEIELFGGDTARWENAAFVAVPTLEMILEVQTELGDTPGRYGPADCGPGSHPPA